MDTLSDERVLEIIAGCEGVTPGPWRQDGKSNGGPIIRGRDGTYIARANQLSVWDADDFDELAANAVLKDAIEIVARLEKRA